MPATTALGAGVSEVVACPAQTWQYNNVPDMDDVAVLFFSAQGYACVQHAQKSSQCQVPKMLRTENQNIDIPLATCDRDRQMNGGMKSRKVSFHRLQKGRSRQRQAGNKGKRFQAQTA